MDNKELKLHANEVRKNIVTMVHSANSGHPGGSLSCADILTFLYFEKMNINNQNVMITNRDRFVLSKGHASPALYGVLKEAGFMDEDINTFRQIDSKLQGHPNMNYLDAVDMSTGSLGQGISCAVGMALANKLDNNDNKVYVLVGDGESEEGLVWEAMMAAAHYRLDNLCVIFDLNHLQIDGKIEDVMNPTDHVKKAKAFNFHVTECDGNDFSSLRTSFEEFGKVENKPTCIIAHTVKGKGVSFMENDYAWHGKAPSDKEYEQAMKDLKGVK